MAIFSKVKVDFSIESKSKGNDTTIPGCYAIYTRTNIFHKWKQKQTYADLDWAKTDAKGISQMPIYY